MITGRRSTDWLSDPGVVSNENDRRGDERRSEDRRAPRRHYDPMFAATLLNQVKPATDIDRPRPAQAYQSPLGRPFCGALLNVKA